MTHFYKNCCFLRRLHVHRSIAYLQSRGWRPSYILLLSIGHMFQSATKRHQTLDRKVRTCVWACCCSGRHFGCCIAFRWLGWRSWLAVSCCVTSHFTIKTLVKISPRTFKCRQQLSLPCHSFTLTAHISVQTFSRQNHPSKLYGQKL